MPEPAAEGSPQSPKTVCFPGDWAPPQQPHAHPLSTAAALLQPDHVTGLRGGAQVPKGSQGPLPYSQELVLPLPSTAPSSSS